MSIEALKEISEINTDAVMLRLRRKRDSHTALSENSTPLWKEGQAFPRLFDHFFRRAKTVLSLDQFTRPLARVAVLSVSELWKQVHVEDALLVLESATLDADQPPKRPQRLPRNYPQRERLRKDR